MDYHLADFASPQQVRVLDAIDSLRSCGINKNIPLPQIIVCGDQSSGKSSLLAALSGVPFAIKGTLCTRFPIEIVLRNSSHASASVRIVPHHSRSETERQRLSNFEAKLPSFDDVSRLSDMIEEAKKAMGLLTSGNAFSSDVLHVEINGPQCPHLTLVDLPGLIHSGNRQQSATDVHLIKDIVQRYMEEPRSIILAVISAKNDYANQIVLQLCQSKPDIRERTLGVVTKPDTLHPGSDSEAMYLGLMRNEDVKFGHGWHAVRNPDSEISGSAKPAAFSQEEKAFFSTGTWASSGLPPSSLSVGSLILRLGNILFDKIESALPRLVDELSHELLASEGQLIKLGPERPTEQQQLKYLAQCSQEFSSLVSNSVNGNYDSAVYSSGDTSLRIRATCQRLSEEFGKLMEDHGRLHKVRTSNTPYKVYGKEIEISERAFIKKLGKKIKNCRGQELPGVVSSSIVTELFREETSLWEGHTRNYITSVYTHVLLSLRAFVNHAADSASCRPILLRFIKPKLDQLKKDMEAKLVYVLESIQGGHAMTFSSSFERKLQKSRQRRTSSPGKRSSSMIPSNLY